MRIPVSHYGLHWAEGGVAFLHQERDVQNATGMDLESPFEIQAKGKCNHIIKLSAGEPADEHLEFFRKMEHDPLVQAMLPIPGQGPVWVDEVSKPFFICLSKLSSPIKSPVQPFWAINATQLMKELLCTNVQPLVLFDIRPNEQREMDRTSEVGKISPRRLILAGSPSVLFRPGIERIKSNITKFDLEDLIQLPWEQIGAWVLRKHMRREV